MISRVPVESSHLASVGHDGAALLETGFTDGSACDYYAVPREIHDGLLCADSKGRYFEEHVKGRLGYSRVA